MNDSTQLQSGGLSSEWQERLANAAKQAQEAEKQAGNFFSTKSGVLSYNNMALPGNKMQVIALAAMHEHVYYGAPYSANVVMTPKCYAFSPDGSGMAPHKDAAEKQHTSCTGCPRMVWGTGDNGKGTACKPIRKLALLPSSAADTVANVQSAASGILRISVTNVKHWAAYVAQCAIIGKPPFAMVTEIALVPDARTQMRFVFTPVRPIEDGSILQAIEARAAVEMSALSTPYAIIAPAPVQQAAAPAQQFTPQPAPAAPQQPAAPAFGAPPPPVKF